MSVACFCWAAWLRPRRGFRAPTLVAERSSRSSVAQAPAASRGQEAPSSPKVSDVEGQSVLEEDRVATTLPLFRAGDIAEEYDFHEVLGTGGFGRVLTAVNVVTEELVAVKKMRARQLRRPERLFLELSIAAELEHPNVARLLEVYSDGGDGVYMVMERCSGGELFDRIPNGGLDEAVAASYTRQMLAGIGYLHSRGVAHRDVKPENLLLESPRPDALLKLVDFGLSRHFVHGEHMTTRVGTAYYIAPEVLCQRYDERVDVWSAGVIAYTCLTGMPPFTGATDQQVLAKVRRGVVDFSGPRWREVSEEAQEMVAAMLTLEPHQRPAAFDALRLQWMASLPRSAAAGATPRAAALLHERRRAFLRRPLAERVARTAAAWRLPDGEVGDLARSYSEAASAAAPPQDAHERGGPLDPATSYMAWLAASADPEALAQPQVVLAAFRGLDRDSDGVVSRDDVAALLAGRRHDGSSRAAAGAGANLILASWPAEGLCIDDFAELLGVFVSEADADSQSPRSSLAATETDGDIRHALSAKGHAVLRIRSCSQDSLSTAAPSVAG